MSLNTTPRTWMAGEIATAAEFNTEVRDAIAGLQAAWTAYVPTWTATVTNPVLNNGSFNGSAYHRVGKTVMFRYVLTMGSGTTYGSGQWIFSVPFAPIGGTVRVPFAADYYDAGVNAWRGHATFFTGGNLYLYCDPTTAGNPAAAVGAATPFTFGTGDQVVVAGTYEAA